MRFRKFLTFLLLFFSCSQFVVPIGASRQDPVEIIEGGDNVAPPFQDDLLNDFFKYAEADSVVRIAVILSDIFGKKDMEFTRGLLMGIHQSQLPQESLALKLINGEIPEDSLEYELELMDPHFILTTHDRDVPKVLNNYSTSHNVKIFNIFDTKGDDYLYNENFYELLTPSQVFNSAVSSFLNQEFKGNILVIVGDPDTSDLILRDMILAWPEDELLILSAEDYPSLILDEGSNYIVYPASSSGSDVKEILQETLKLMSNFPGAGVRVIGRPNWVAFNELNTMISNMEVFIPAKCYFNPTSTAGKKFISDYHSMFGHAPIRSYPVYAVMGYDFASYFLPLFIEDKNLQNDDLRPADMNQSYFDIVSPKAGIGGYNKGSMILHFEPWGSLYKEIIR